MAKKTPQGQPMELSWMETPEPVKQAAAPDPMAELQRTVADLKAQVMAGQATNAVLSSQPMFEARPNLNTEPDFSKLPEPADAGYPAAVAQAIATAAANKEALSKWEGNQRAKASKATEKLFADFKKEYPDYAKNRKAVEVFAEEVVEDVDARHMDAAKYMFSQPKAFFTDIVAKMDEAGFGKKALEKDPDADEDDNRADGIPGGGEASDGTPVKASKAKQPDSMFAGLTGWQQKTGFHP